MKKGLSYGLGIRVLERDGRVTWNGEDWGAVVPLGSKLACCGCILVSPSKPETPICECRCHNVHRHFHHLI